MLVSQSQGFEHGKLPCLLSVRWSLAIYSGKESWPQGQENGKIDSVPHQLKYSIPAPHLDSRVELSLDMGGRVCR